MSKKIKIYAFTVLVLVLFVHVAKSQPPPPPPDNPPCWPPPCIPVNNGILFAIFGAVLFGVAALWRSLRNRIAD